MMPAINRRWIEWSPYDFECDLLHGVERRRINMDVTTGDEELRCRIVVTGHAPSFDFMETILDMYRSEKRFVATVAGHPMKFVTTRMDMPWPPTDMRFSFEAVSIWFESERRVHPVILLRRRRNPIQDRMCTRRIR